MSLSDEERKIIVSFEAEKARNTFAEIPVLRQAGLWKNKCHTVENGVTTSNVKRGVRQCFRPSLFLYVLNGAQ